MKNYPSILLLLTFCTYNFVAVNANFANLEDQNNDTMEDIPGEEFGQVDISFGWGGGGHFFSIGYKPKPIYFDLTDAINNQNYTEIGRILNHTSNVYFLTDTLITEIHNLDWILNTLNSDIFGRNENSSLCLMVAFQMTKNRNNFNWWHIKDLLTTSYTPAKSNSELGKYLCGIILDFQLGSLQSVSSEKNSFQYIKKWDLSFTKFTKKIVTELFGNETNIPVGTMYNEQQLHPYYKEKSDILFHQEIQHSDFQIINIELSPVTRMPLTYEQFHNFFDNISRKNLKYFSRNIPQGNTTRNLSGFDTSFMITWTHFDMYFPSAWAYEAVVNSSEPAYLKLLEEFVWTSTRAIDIRVISGSKFNLQASNPSNLEDFETNDDHILPYLYLHDVDTTSCQLKTMLKMIALQFNTLVVNEFTWSSLARNEAIMKTLEDDKCAANSQGALKLPQNAILFASIGIGKHWNLMHDSFINLIEEHQTIDKMSLTTIVFASDDLRTDSSQSSDTGVQKFVESWTKKNLSDVGCLVNVSRRSLGDPIKFVEFVKNECHPIYEYSSVFVWEYTINVMSLFSNEEIYEHEVFKIQFKLLSMLAAREVFISSGNTDQQIVFKIVLKNEKSESEIEKSSNACDMTRQNKMKFTRGLLQWANIHKVKLVLQPAFDFKDPLEGIWMPPNENGSETWSAGHLFC